MTVPVYMCICNTYYVYMVNGLCLACECIKELHSRVHSLFACQLPRRHQELDTTGSMFGRLTLAGLGLNA